MALASVVQSRGDEKGNPAGPLPSLVLCQVPSPGEMLTIIGWLAHALSRQREREKKTRTCNLRYVVCHDFYEKDGGYTTEQFLLPIMHFIGVGYTKKMHRDLFDE